MNHLKYVMGTVLLLLAAGANRAQEKQAMPAVRIRAAAGVAMPAQAWPDEQFEQWVFNQNRNAAGARRVLDSQLTLHVEEIGRTCKLTDTQKAKIRLMGSGDIKRFFDRFETAKLRFNALNNDIQQIQEMMPIIQPLQAILQTGTLFGARSLFHKSLHNILTAEQFVKYEVVVQQREKFRHRAQIEFAVETLEQSVPLRDLQRVELIAMIESETKPLLISGQFDLYLMMEQIGQLPPEKIKPLLSDTQWKVFNQQLTRYRGFVPNMRLNGVFVDNEAAIEAPPAAIRR